MNANKREVTEITKYIQRKLTLHSVKYLRILKLVKIAVVLKIVILLIVIISRLL
jgi:hypothetical protein